MLQFITLFLSFESMFCNLIQFNPTNIYISTQGSNKQSASDYFEQFFAKPFYVYVLIDSWFIAVTQKISS